ncbi:endonuclease/exonuclease/phosphatase family protein [Phytohabitans kaempferiae]|uniref:Endonuclease/exonuclease/phosphatase family protein n=1 Tax=Phytohabitans kaempferiae TaxID=1620943 RepID=A0ABV6MGG9_9ACTN
MDLRVLTYNVHSLKDDQAALAAVVRDIAPDVLILQEGPRRFRWRGKGAALARSFDMLVAAGGLPSLGNLIFTNLRVRVHDAWSIRLPHTPGRHMRGAAFAECSVGAARFVAAGSHLSTDAAERPAQAAELRAALSKVELPVVLGADLNESSAGSAWRLLAEGMTDAAVAAGGRDRPTFSCANPRDRIDALFIDPRVSVLGYDVVDTPEAHRASDHFPVVAHLHFT